MVMTIVVEVMEVATEVMEVVTWVMEVSGVDHVQERGIEDVPDPEIPEMITAISGQGFMERPKAFHQERFRELTWLKLTDVKEHQ